MKALTKSVRELTSSVDQRVDWLALWEVVVALDRALMRVLTGARRLLGRVSASRPIGCCSCCWWWIGSWCLAAVGVPRGM